MEKVKAKKTLKARSSDFMLRILAIVLAVIVWLILSITQYPTINKTITNIPVTFSMDGTLADEKGLEALNYNDISVDVEIKGMNYEIGSYGANDLVASVNLDSVTKEGTYLLDIEVKSAHSSDRVSVVSVSPDTIEVSFVHIDQDTFSISVEAPDVTADAGKMIYDTATSPSEIEVKGPEGELAKIAKVAAVYDQSVSLEDDTTLHTDAFKFYDSNGAELDPANFTIINKKGCDITFLIYKKKTLKLGVEFTDCPPGFKPSTLPYTLSETELSIITPDLSDVDEQQLILGTISMNDVDFEKSFSFNIDDKLTSEEINKSGVSVVDLTFDLEESNYSTKTISVPSSAVKTVGLPSGKVLDIDTKQLPYVKLYGPADVLYGITVDDLSVVLDLSDLTNNGTYTHPVSISVSDHDNVWASGSYDLQIELREAKVAATDSSSESED